MPRHTTAAQFTLERQRITLVDTHCPIDI